VTPAALADLVRSVAHDVLAGRGVDATVLPAAVTVERPRDPACGHYATNVALRSAMPAGVAPREFAGWLAEALVRCPGVRSVEVAGPGFLNLRLATDAQGEIVAQVLTAGKRFGTGPDLAPIEKVTVEAVRVDAAQYAHAELTSLARNAADLGISSDGAQLGLLSHPREGELIRTLGEFPRIVAAGVSGAAQLRKPHRLVRYLEQLVSAYDRFSDACRVLPMGDEQSGPEHAARLALCEATRQVLANGLGLLGVRAPERM
jgi:arginyl-tRNA synthetase